MNSELYEIGGAQPLDVCARVAVAGLLYDYVADLLDDPAAGEFEEHLLDCCCCRREYLRLLSLRGAKAAAEPARDEDRRAPGGARVFSLAGFRKG